MTTKLGIHVSPTITSDVKIFQVCKQQQIASGNKLLIVIHLVSNYSIVVYINDSKTYIVYTRVQLCAIQFTMRLYKYKYVTS